MSPLTAKPAKVLTIREARKVIKRATYIVKGLIPERGYGVLWGPPGSLKTFWALDLAGHVVTGRTYHTHAVKQGPVVYCPYEGVHGLLGRLDALRFGMHLAEEFSDDFMIMEDPPRFEHNALAGHKSIIEGIRETGRTPRLVIVDTLHRSLVGGENNDDDMSYYINAAMDISKAFGCFVLLVHHTGKVGTDPRGHSSLRGDANLMLRVNRQGEKGTTSDMITVTVDKMKDGPEGEAIHNWVRICDIGIDEDGEPETSCFLEPAPAPQNAQHGLRRNDKDAKAYAALESIVNENGQSTTDAWKRKYLEMHAKGKSADAARMGFTRSMTRLLDNKIIALDGSVVTILGYVK